MIHINRSDVDPPLSLTVQAGSGVDETRKAIEFYSDPQNKDKKFDFKEYRKPDVKDRLIKLFNGKCAYCEGSVPASHDGDVEHFRPKGAVEINNQMAKPGYYWLAAHWDNLFLSCQHCNQKRKHRLEGGGTLAAGKTSKFPVGDENDRVTHNKLPDDLVDQGQVDMDQLKELCENEPRLLLDPCLDDPQEHLAFHNDGAVVPAVTAEEAQVPLGHNSIMVFGLHRPQLINDRATELVKIHSDMDHVRQVAGFLDSDPSNPALTQIMQGAIGKLEVHCQPKQRYSAMARQLVDEFKEEITGG